MEQEDKDLHQKQEENKAQDKAGIGQTDEEKGIAPDEVREQKRKELEDEGKAKRRPNFNGDLDEEHPPMQLEE